MDSKHSKSDGMKLSNRKRVGMASALVAAFLILFIILIFTYSFPQLTPDSLRVLISYHFEFMIAMVGLSAIFGAAMVYLMREEVHVHEKQSKINAQLALSLLGNGERQAVSLLLERKGECLQAEVARLQGMNRLKAHRVVHSLSQRNVVSTEKRGKTVVLKLADAFKHALLEE